MVVGDVPTAADILVVGAGPAGYVAAIRAAQLGRHVTLVGNGPIGGTCLNRGCIPLKALLTATERYQQTRETGLATMGIHVSSVSYDWAEMQRWKQSIVERLAEGVHRLIAGHHIEYIQGTGRLLSGQEIRVEGEQSSHRFTFADCIFAVGALAAPCELPYDNAQVLTPEQALALPTQPSALSIYGNNYIALELATLFARLGTAVKLYIPGDRLLLPTVDPVALRLVQAGLRRLGVQVTMQATLADCTERPLVISNGMQPQTDQLHPQAAALHIDEVGAIVVNSMQQTNLLHIYAVGDCTGGSYLANMAIKQAKVAAEVASGRRIQFAPLVTPLVVHTTPELATVGYSAEEAVSAGYTITTGRFPFAANGRALSLGTDSGIALVVANADNEVLLGATLVGPRAGDLIGQIALAIEMGATLTDMAEILYAHPGLSEVLQESAEQALGRAIHLLTKSPTLPNSIAQPTPS